MNEAVSETRLPLPRLLGFSLAALPVSAASVAVFVYLPPYFAGHLGVSMALVGSVWMLVRLVDVPVDVGLALAMDRTVSPIGRYKPWVLLGAPILCLAFWRLFMAPAHFGAAYLGLWLLVMYLGQSIASLSASAWGASLAGAYHERSRLFGVQTAVGVLGAVMVLMIPTIGHSLGRTDAGDVTLMGWTMVVGTPVCAGLAALTTPDRIRLRTAGHGGLLAWKGVARVLAKPDLLRLFLAQMSLALGPGWMSALYIFFFTQSLRFSVQQASALLAVYVISGAPGALGMAALSRRIGKHRALMVSTTAFSLGLFSVLILPKGDMALGAAIMAFEGAMAASFGLMIQAMLADVGDEVRLDQGQERMSLVFALNGLAQKIAAAFSIGLSLPLLQALGFNPLEGAHNSAAALHRLDWAFLFGPVVFVMLGGACMIGWRLDAARQEDVRRQLALRESLVEREVEGGSTASA